MHKNLLILLLFIIKLTQSNAQAHWKLSTDQEGIKIYTSPVPGSKVKALKVECEFNATPSQFVAVLMDVRTAADWVYHTKSCTLVKQVSPSELYYYSEISIPWPAQNRDFVAHLTVHQDPQTNVVTVDGPSVPGFVPVKDGVVRIAHSSGQWIIAPDGGNVKVTYILQVDPGGAIPAWLVNMFATEGPLQSFRKLKLQLKKQAYRNMDYAFVSQ